MKVEWFWPENRPLTTGSKKPVALQQAINYFSDADRAFRYAIELRWPDGKIICPRCGSEKHSFVSTRKIWFCAGCKKQFTLKVGTIFEDSALGIDTWMAAVWMIVNCKSRISSYELHRNLGITQKSAWFMLHRIREAVRAFGDQQTIIMGMLGCGVRRSLPESGSPTGKAQGAA